jgi:hypothetical protein
VIQQSFLDEIPIHLGGCDRTGDRDQPLHASTSLKGSGECRQRL